jgi:HD-GYP domain-containing protein (c-di-GMP phosphodiesterase class II)
MQRNTTVNLGNLLLSLSEALDLASPALSQHQLRVAFISWEVAKQAILPNPIKTNIFMAALLHDIGAMSVEEKMSLLSFDEKYSTPHSIHGERLLRRVPFLAHTAGIIRNHHREWQAWDKPIETPEVLASQAILLAGHIDLLIDRSRYILHQNESITERVKGLSGKTIHPDVIDCFLPLSCKEEFWLDLASSRLYTLLLHNGPCRNIRIDLQGILTISELFRDIIDFRSRFTFAHTSGVSACAGALANFYGLTEKEVQLLRIAGNLHDVGKLCVPNSILEKPGALTPEEFAVMKSHAYYTYQIIDTIDGLQEIAEWAGYHHERMDGSGYPFHCRAEDLTIGSRIMAVADIFTAISEERPYRKGMQKEDVRTTMNLLASGKLLDKRVTDMLLDNYDRVFDCIQEAQSVARAFYESQFLPE